MLGTTATSSLMSEKNNQKKKSEPGYLGGLGKINCKLF